MTKTDPEYLPDLSLILRPADAEAEEKLVGKAAVETLATAIRGAAFEFDQDDLVTVATADSLKVVDADEYARGYELLGELATIETRIADHYHRFDKPLNFLTQVVRKLKGPQAAQVAPVKKALSARLGAWKAAEDERARQEARRKQEVADAAARAAQAAKAAALERVAAIEPDPKLAASFLHEADAVRNVTVSAAPVPVENMTPIVSGYTRTTWRCEFTDLKALMLAYVEGRCFFPDEALIDSGLQGYMDKQASNLGENLSKAFPGTKAVPVYKGIARRR